MHLLSQNNKWATISIIGIAIAFAAVFLVSSYTKHELSFDTFHKNADNIYRIQINTPGRVGFMETMDYAHFAAVNSDYLPSLYEHFSAIKNIVFLNRNANNNAKIKDQVYRLENTYFTDQSFFEVFNFKLLKGSTEKLFQEPLQVVLSKKTALKYYGSVDIIGKEFIIKNQYSPTKEVSYTIKAIFDEFPKNSHMTPDVLLSRKTNELIVNSGSAYTYLELQKNTTPTDIENQVNKFWKNNIKESEIAPTFELINLKDIHLKSHKKDEFKTNGSLNSLLVLIAGSFIIFLIAAINYFNLNTVQFISQINNYRIKIINGAEKYDLSKDKILNTLVYLFIAIGIGIFLIFKFKHFTKLQLSIPFYWELLGIIILAFIIIFCLLSILPLYTAKLQVRLSETIEQGSKKFIISLVFQFILSISAIILTIVLQQQINYIQELHPGKNKNEIISIHEIPYSAIGKYTLYKEILESKPEIDLVSATFFPPGMEPAFEYPFEMEGIEKKRLLINSMDKDFLKFFNVKPLAGSINLTSGSTFEWEKKAICPTVKIAKENLAKLNPSLCSFKEQYVLNESALRFLNIKNPEDAIGRRFKCNFVAPMYFKEGEIVAVIKDLHYSDLFSKEKPMVICLKRYFNSTFLVKAHEKQRGKALETVKKEWKNLFPDNPIKYEYLNDTYNKIYRNQQNESKALSIFAFLAIVLSMLGMFALSSYSIQNKTKEIGIRKANGASSFEILLQLIGEYTVWIGLAFIIASPIAFYLAKDWLRSFAYKVDIAWWYFIVGGAIAFTIGIATVSWQTWNASRQDPVIALKCE